MQNKLPLPIGASNYKLVSTEYYYVDKTLLIKELLDERAVITLFTRPRRFGKTLNMDMLRTFFEKTPEDTSKYFKDKKIWQAGEKYTSQQGKYPVIFLSLKDANKDNWQDLYSRLKATITDEFLRHKELKKALDCLILLSTKKLLQAQVIQQTMRPAFCAFRKCCMSTTDSSQSSS